MHPQEPPQSTSPSKTTITITTTESIDPSSSSTAPTSRALYFAYGSNLSPSQMHQRCRKNPDISSRPVAIARLDHWRWLICQPGYANVVPPPDLRIGHQEHEGEDVPISGEEDTVYGVLYDMDPRDELLLDGYEGVDHDAPAAGADGKVPVEVRPKQQGRGDYNKWYVSATVTQWLDEEQRVRWGGATRGDDGEVPVLVYVDEERVRVASPRDEYIPRMNRAIRESGELGFPKKWTEEVMRKFIPVN
ncbi:alpha mannosidase-like protein [Aspergillus nanangensis]|uniref:gamma-glutamylcyclotransferase n=1 Tax=Aspergillus nanangensis TaxID=2582783 RepID=A0AAD4GP92_ASPNN|nr:alpha mannosidase-like protein [Aspergillus nanangensis]